MAQILWPHNRPWERNAALQQDLPLLKRRKRQTERVSSLAACKARHARTGQSALGHTYRNRNRSNSVSAFLVEAPLISLPTPHISAPKALVCIWCHVRAHEAQTARQHSQHALMLSTCRRRGVDRPVNRPPGLQQRSVTLAAAAFTLAPPSVSACPADASTGLLRLRWPALLGGFASLGCWPAAGTMEGGPPAGTGAEVLSPARFDPPACAAQGWRDRRVGDRRQSACTTRQVAVWCCNQVYEVTGRAG